MEEPPDTSGNDMDAEWDKSDNLKIDIEDGDVIGVRNVDSEGEITAEDARGGRDIQGIPWERIYFTREGCRVRNPARVPFSLPQRPGSNRVGRPKHCPRTRDGGACPACS